MTDLIKLKDAADVSGPMEPGEIAIDEAAGKLLVDRGDSAMVDELPLDVLPVPEIDAPGGAVYIFQDGEIVAATLSAGGGGRPFDDAEWRVPGVIVLAVEEIELDAEIVREIEFTQPTTITYFGYDASAAVEVVFVDPDGVTLYDDLIAPEEPVDIDVVPGRYTLSVAPFDGSVTMRAIVACRAWGVAPETFPIFFKVST